MKVSLVCSALPGMGPRAVLERAVSGWLGARGGDDVAGLATSEGETTAHVGTGLDDVVRLRHPDATATSPDDDAPRRIHWTWQGGALIDLADAMTWAGEGDPIGSTAFLASDLRELRATGARSVHVHVPRLMNRSDLGLGLLGALAGEPIDVREEPRDLTEQLAKAQRAVSDMAITLTYPADMPLLGVDGMARMWDQAGMDGQVAQDFERHIGGWVHELDRAGAASTRRSLLGGVNVDPRVGSSGTGGGLGMMIGLLGGARHLIGDYLVGSALPSDADLIVYVCSAIGVDLPSGLHAATRHGEELGVPVVLLTDSAGMRKGELPRLGLHGSYELRPERAFGVGVEDMDAISTIPGRLDDAIARIATTWGWDF